MNDLFSEKPPTGLSGEALEAYLNKTAQASIEKTWMAAWDAATERAANICDDMADRIAAGDEWTPLGAVEECADAIRDGSNARVERPVAASGDRSARTTGCAAGGEE